MRLLVLVNIHNDLGHLMGAIGKTDQQIVQYKEAQKTAEEIRNTDLLGYVDMNLGMAYSNTWKIRFCIFARRKCRPNIYSNRGIKDGWATSIILWANSI